MAQLFLAIGNLQKGRYTTQENTFVLCFVSKNVLSILLFLIFKICLLSLSSGTFRQRYFCQFVTCYVTRYTAFNDSKFPAQGA